MLNFANLRKTGQAWGFESEESKLLDRYTYDNTFRYGSISDAVEGALQNWLERL